MCKPAAKSKTSELEFAFPADTNGSLSDSEVRVIQHHKDLVSVLGPSTKHTLLITSSKASRGAFFHSGCVFNPATNELWTTSAPLQTTSSASLPVVLFSKIALETEETDRNVIKSMTWQKLRPPNTMLMPAGGTLYNNGVLWAAQGVLARNTAGIAHMADGKMPEVLVRGYHGREFNSPYDVAVTKEGDVWFTDPYMGGSDWRPKPLLPQQVFRFTPATGEVRSMADQFYRPRGITLSPDQSTLYVTDSGPGDDTVTAEGMK